ncbi:hypothetical protein K3148_03760 [Qipengyuania aurantiaca]|uniref:Uncharacterized protein n=1 Tax=Qipengyuania aurantiaca TaxID=2867233 RepID=A0ABX8ZNF9_9SPHN|nr:hypothetical protein [Qipengyuania aurantiaca]QZD90520.1 hypothetical protein K3148_03760 [Qipengyuania aurantiaca]
MNKTYFAVSAALIVSPIAAHAQEAQNNRVQVMNAQPQSAQAASAPVAAPEAAPAVKTVVLPANSEVLLRMSEELSTKGGRVKEGQMFRLTVVHDVKVNGVTVIPMGTPATGEVTWKTGRAVFGKSGKMEVALRYVDLNGERIELAGEYRQEGEGDTLAAVGAVVLAAPLMVITGKSAIIPRGKEMMAHTVAPFTVTVAS